LPEPTPWLAYHDQKPEHLVRLFCLPYGGGGASIYRDWNKALPTWVQVCPIQLPGRETRSREPPFSRWRPLVEELVVAIRPYLDRPFALFGHSLGALISFECARSLRRQGLPLPQHVFASACPAPKTIRFTTRHLQPAQELAEELARLGGTPAELLHNREYLNCYLPTFRADCEVYETYVYEADAPLPSAITAYRGSHDVEVSHDETVSWRAETAGRFELRTLVGGHLFIQGQPEALLRDVTQELNRCCGH
jgi:surfactin synthase thioesterase subunit